MKEKKKLKAIKKHIKNFPGVSLDPQGNRTRKTISFEVSNHEDITSSISALLELCYYSLDGNGVFVSPKHSNKTPTNSVTKVLEMVIDSCLTTKCSVWIRSLKSFPHRNSKNRNLKYDDMKPKRKDLEKLIRSAKYKLITLEPSNVQTGKFKASFLQFDGYLDLFITIESLINVCIMASHVNNSNGTEDDGLDIRKTLQLANKLLPFDEGEFLDNVNVLLKDNRSND